MYNREGYEGKIMDLRREIGRRLHAEMRRKCLNAADLAEHSGLSSDSVTDYLRGSKEIRFTDLTPLCATLGIPIMRLLTHSETSSVRIAYRKTRPTDRAVVAKAEDVFLWIEDFLPRFHQPPVPLPSTDTVTDAHMLIAEINAFIGRMKASNPSLEYWYNTLGIALAGNRHSNSDIQRPDGLCLSDKQHTLILVNTDCPDVRLHFTLLHELWHAICDRQRDIPPDHLPSELYDEKLSDDIKPEFCANKFAQFWIISFEIAENIARKLRTPSGLTQQDVEEALHDTGGSPEVLANAVYDVARYAAGRHKSYAAIRDEIRALAVSWTGRSSTRAFVTSKTLELGNILKGQQDKFGEHAWNAIQSLIL